MKRNSDGTQLPALADLAYGSNHMVQILRQMTFVEQNPMDVRYSTTSTAHTVVQRTCPETLMVDVRGCNDASLLRSWSILTKNRTSFRKDAVPLLCRIKNFIESLYATTTSWYFLLSFH